MKNKQALYRWLIYIIFGVLITVLQMTPGFLPAISNTKPLLVIPYIICLSAIENEFIAAVTGGITGLLWGIWGTAYPLGYTAALLLIIGCVCGLIINQLMGVSPMSVFIVGFVAILLFQIIDWFLFYKIWGYDGSSYAFFSINVPAWLYTSVFIPLFYFMVRKISVRLNKII